MSESWDSVWRGADMATMAAGPSETGDGFGTLRDGAMAIRDGRIDWIGPAGALPVGGIGPHTAVHDLGGGWITPGLIDCHTHLVYGGEPAHEFEQRLNGPSYQEIARDRGGSRAPGAGPPPRR